MLRKNLSTVHAIWSDTTSVRAQVAKRTLLISPRISIVFSRDASTPSLGVSSIYCLSVSNMQFFGIGRFTQRWPHQNSSIPANETKLLVYTTSAPLALNTLPRLSLSSRAGAVRSLRSRAQLWPAAVDSEVWWRSTGRAAAGSAVSIAGRGGWAVIDLSSQGHRM